MNKMASCNREQSVHKLSKKDERTLDSIFNPNLPYGDVAKETQENEDIEAETPELIKVKNLELAGVQAAEKGDFISAIDHFNQAIHLAPNRASGYNNRAQALRLNKDVQGAVQDLNKAVELSEGRGKAACQAYTQRGLIHKLEGCDEKALEDFQRASKLGGKFAKEMCVALNPYAAMCNAMLSEVIHKVKTGEA